METFPFLEWQLLDMDQSQKRIEYILWTNLTFDARLRNYRRSYGDRRDKGRQPASEAKQREARARARDEQ